MSRTTKTALNTSAMVEKKSHIPSERKPLSSFIAGSTSVVPFIPPKLTVNEPGDAYEQQADAMAERVMRMSDPTQPLRAAPVHSLQRKCAHCEEDDKLQRKESGTTTPTAPASVHQTLTQSGQPLSAQSRAFFEPRFGQDFSGVRIHTDGSAAESARAINALAYTSGANVVFGSGQYQPESETGKRLLAHELTHVVQQREGASRKIQRSFWGTVGGTITGAVGGFLVGGPVGAVLGGVAGGVAGDAVTTHTRPLNTNELIEATKVFGGSLDYGKVRVTDSSALMPIGGYARTPGNTVYFPAGTLGRTDYGYYAFLIHEMTHTWQTQHGISVFTKIRYALSESNYDFGGDAGLQQAITDGKCFRSFNTEAQASIIAQYYGLLMGQKTGNISLYSHFVRQMQQFSGNCS